MSRLFGFVSCGGEVVEAFVVGEQVADGTDGFPEDIAGSGSSFPEQSPDLGKYEGANAMRSREPLIDFDRAEAGAIGRQQQEPAADVA